MFFVHTKSKRIKVFWFFFSKKNKKSAFFLKKEAKTSLPLSRTDEDRPRGGRFGIWKPQMRLPCPLTGTPLSGLHDRERWGDQAQALIAVDWRR